MNQIRLHRCILGFYLVVMSVLVGCSPSLPTAEPSQAPAAQPTPQVVVHPTDTPGLLPVPSAGASTPSILAAETVTALAPQKFAICTPLQDHALDQLRLIVSDPYRPPKGKSDARHHGVDFSYYRFGERDTIQGVGVQAVLPGQVAAALVDSYPFGNLVIVETEGSLLPTDLGEWLGATAGESLYLLYAHMESAPGLRIGDRVEACQQIGAVGNSGNTVEPHLHLEARLGPPATVFHAMGEYFAAASAEERANYRLWRTSGVYRHLDPMLLVNYALGK